MLAYRGCNSQSSAPSQELQFMADIDEGVQAAIPYPTRMTHSMKPRKPIRMQMINQMLKKKQEHNRKLQDSKALETLKNSMPLEKLTQQASFVGESRFELGFNQQNDMIMKLLDIIEKDKENRVQSKEKEVSSSKVSPIIINNIMKPEKNVHNDVLLQKEMQIKVLEQDRKNRVFNVRNQENTQYTVLRNQQLNYDSNIELSSSNLKRYQNRTLDITQLSDFNTKKHSLQVGFPSERVKATTADPHMFYSNHPSHRKNISFGKENQQIAEIEPLKLSEELRPSSSRSTFSQSSLCSKIVKKEEQFPELKIDLAGKSIEQSPQESQRKHKQSEKQLVSKVQQSEDKKVLQVTEPIRQSIFLQIPLGDTQDNAEEKMSLAEAFKKRLGKLSSQKGLSKSPCKQPAKKSDPKINTFGLKSRKPSTRHGQSITSNLSQEESVQNPKKQAENLLLDRLIHGEKAKIDKKAMYALTKKNYENLPEVQAKKKQMSKKKLELERLDKIKEFQKNLRSPKCVLRKG